MWSSLSDQQHLHLWVSIPKEATQAPIPLSPTYPYECKHSLYRMPGLGSAFSTHAETIRELRAEGMTSSAPPGREVVGWKLTPASLVRLVCRIEPEARGADGILGNTISAPAPQLVTATPQHLDPRRCKGATTLNPVPGGREGGREGEWRSGA